MSKVKLFLIIVVLFVAVWVCRVSMAIVNNGGLSSNDNTAQQCTVLGETSNDINWDCAASLEWNN